MTKKLQNLLKAKEIINNRMDLNENLLITIQEIKQDETTLQEECKAYRVILSLINKEIKKEQSRRY